MFPYAENSPALFNKEGCYFPVSSPVALDLFYPISSVALWKTAQRWVAVPETAVNENCKTLLVEHEVRAAKNLGAPSPTSNPVSGEETLQANFSRLVPGGPYPRHCF